MLVERIPLGGLITRPVCHIPDVGKMYSAIMKSIDIEMLVNMVRGRCKLWDESHTKYLYIYLTVILSIEAACKNNFLIFLKS